MLKPKKRLTRREMKEDKLVTVWFKAADYIDQYSRQILIGAGALVVVIAGLVWYNFYLQQQDEKASVLFAAAKRAYNDQKYDAAVDSLSRLVNDYSGTASAGLGTLYLANALMVKKDYENAEKYYRTYLDDYDSDPILNVAAAAGIAATFDERGDYAKSGELYEKAAKTYSESYRAPELLMNAARAYRLANQLDAARRALSLLVEKYPDSKAVEDAKLLQAELQS